MLTDKEFYERYNPEYNQILLKELQNEEDTGSTLPEDLCSFGGCMYETYGEEINYIIDLINNQHKIKNVWTIIECEDTMYVMAGYHLVNRFGYLITPEEWKEADEEYLFE